MYTMSIIQNEMEAIYVEYSNLKSLCLQASAELSRRLTYAGIENYVALGSISSGGKSIIEYEPFDSDEPDMQISLKLTRRSGVE